MKDESKKVEWPAASATDTAGATVVDRVTWQAELDALRVREKAHTREGDAIAAARLEPADVAPRARFDVPDLERRALPWIALQRSTHSFDPYFPRHAIR